MKQKRKWKDLSGGQRCGVVVLASIQLSLAVSAWADLATRPAARVNGKKSVWAAVIAVNYIGPIAYFVGGRRRD